MFRLIHFELKKLIGKRTIWIILLLFSIINLVKITSVYRENSYLYSSSGDTTDWYNIHWQLYPDIQGKITPERIDTLLQLFRPIESQVAEQTASTRLDNPNTMTGNIYSDYNLLRKYFVLPMEAFYSYKQKAEQTAKAAQKNAVFYQDRGNTYEARKNAWIYHQYINREIDSFAYMEMANYYVHYDFSSALILLLGIYGVAGIFVREKESDMEGLLLVNPNGGKATAAAKIAAASLFLTGSSLWFSCIDFLGFSLAFHTLEGYAMPVYAIPNFAAAALSVSVGRYLLISAVVRALGVWTIGMLLLFLARFGKNALIPFLSGIFTCLGLVILGSNFANSGHIWAKVLNPFSLVQNRMIFGKTEFISMAEFPVPSFLAAIAASALTGMFLIIVIFAFSSRNQLCSRRRIRL